jgi:hypothetical protein
MYKISATLHTAGDGLWSNKAKTVDITGLQLSYMNDELDFGELRVFFDTATWDTDTDGLIYTDTLFLEDLCLLLDNLGVDASDVGYSEQGMQGDTYVSLDVGECFINTYMQTV